MNPNNLTAPIFKGKGVDELVLPTFHPVTRPSVPFGTVIT